MSIKLTPMASTFTRASPGPGSGAGRSSSFTAPPPPGVDERDDERQQAQAVIGRQDRHAQQIAETDQHEQMLEASPLAGQSAHLIVEREAVQDFGQGAVDSLDDG